MDETGRSAAADAERADERLSIGRYLAAQRKLRGISLDELAERTRIPRRNLERLEAGAFDGQLDGFVRGFVRTVAEALGLDPREAVMRLVGEPVASDEEWLWRRRMRIAALSAVLAVALLLALGWALRATVRWIREPAPDSGQQRVYRRDAVRELAEEPPRHAPPPTEAPADADADAHSAADDPEP